jgi:hypothetical protein
MDSRVFFPVPASPPELNFFWALDNILEITLSFIAV